MAGRLLESDPNRYPFSGSHIHKQEGQPYMVAVGPIEVEMLPEKQKRGIAELLSRTTPETNLVGFFNTKTKKIHFTDGGSFVVATVNKRGKIKSNVDWIK